MRDELRKGELVGLCLGNDGEVDLGGFSLCFFYFTVLLSF